MSAPKSKLYENKTKLPTPFWQTGKKGTPCHLTDQAYDHAPVNLHHRLLEQKLLLPDEFVAINDALIGFHSNTHNMYAPDEHQRIMSLLYGNQRFYEGP